jgi:4-hydroxy-tetrahydrodipicolinate synthase
MMDLNGLVPAIVTPMKDDGSVDEKALAAYVRWIVPQGPKALAVNTDAGEGPHLLPDEKLRVLAVVAGELAGQIPVVCGLGGPSTSSVLEFGRKAKAGGASAWLVFPSPAFRGTTGVDPVILGYHREVASLGVPMVLFQLQEGLGGAEYPLETIAELVNIPESIAIKEATFDTAKYKKTVEFLRALPRKITILTGNDNFILESFEMGADGALLGFGSVVTREQVDMMRMALAGDFKGAHALYSRINPLAQACFAAPVREYRARLKAVLHMQGVLPSPAVRRPLLPLSGEARAALRQVLAANGFPSGN